MLKVTQLTNYGMAILSKLACESTECHLSSRDLAHTLGLPLSITSKILKSLTKNGILVSHRGIHGGYELARPAISISIAEVVIALEGPISNQSPTRNMEIHPCDFINRTIQQTLAEINLLDMAKSMQISALSNKPSSTINSLCEHNRDQEQSQ